MRWFMLRTSGGQTLPLSRSLRAAGLDVWTPARTIRKTLRPGKPTQQLIEVQLPILPTFVFAREDDLVALAALARVAGLAAHVASQHPAFSVFSHRGRVPFIRDRDVEGLRSEEERAAAVMRAMREAETRAEAERIRIAALRSEAARRRALRAARRAQRPNLEVGTDVRVENMPALVGVTGVIEAVDGAYAAVRFGTQQWKIEGWRLLPTGTDDKLAA